MAVITTSYIITIYVWSFHTRTFEFLLPIRRRDIRDIGTRKKLVLHVLFIYTVIKVYYVKELTTLVCERLIVNFFHKIYPIMKGKFLPEFMTSF